MALIDDVTFFALIFLIGVCLLKFYNVLRYVDFYDVQIAFVTLAVGTISYLFIELGLLLNLDLEFHIYLQVGRILILLVWIFFVAELLLYTARKVVESDEGLTRMRKRRADRMFNNQSF